MGASQKNRGIAPVFAAESRSYIFRLSIVP